jgi:hypothetical protein
MKAFLAVLVAVVLYCLVVFIYHLWFQGSSQVPPKEFIAASASAITVLTGAIYGLIKEKTDPQALTPIQVFPTIRSGLYSGLIAGAVAGSLIGVLYYADPLNIDVEWERIPITFIFGTMTGALLGISIPSGIRLFPYFARSDKPWFLFLLNKDLIGGILGGAAGGLLAGAVGGAFFFPKSGVEVEPWMLFSGSMLGIVALVLCILRYDYKAAGKDAAFSLIVSLVVTGFVAATVVLLFSTLQDGILERISNWNLVFAELCGGAIIGLILGSILGMEVGISLIIYNISRPAALVSAQG